MNDPLAVISTRWTPQAERADVRQIKNAAGGYSFKTSEETEVHRFLVLGTSGGTYYTSERELTRANAEMVLRAACERGEWLVQRIVEISTAGRAPRQNPAIFALAAVSGLADDAGREAALNALPLVCRTGTHLFLFAKYVEQFRGWGPALRHAVSRWYTAPDINDVAYQCVKYQHRESWSHRDLLRLAHPKTTELPRRALFSWITRGAAYDEARFPEAPPLVNAFSAARSATTASAWVRLIEAHPLSWEMLPDAALAEPAVWRALIEKGMPHTALLRQLPRLTRLGVLTGATRDAVTARLTDPEGLRRARVHPINVLVAARTYAAGRSARGEGEWTPDRRVVDALDGAFYAAFGAVEPAGKRTLIALDVSGSMGSSASGLPLSCREVSAALALVTMATEPEVDVVGFTGRGVWGGGDTRLKELSISPRQRLDDAVRAVSDLPFGSTDCALPMVWARENRREYDTIVVMTDNETWSGHIHPHEALREYRESVVPGARLAVVAMTATEVSIADPSDPGSLDIAGMDSAVPTLLADFSRGTL